MNFTISRSVFYTHLAEANHVISPNSPLPALKGFKIQATEDNQLIITASDSNLAIRKVLSNDMNENLNLTIIEPGSIIIDAKFILDIVHKMDSDIISVQILDGALTMIKGQAAQFRINGMKASEYPTIDLSKPASEFTLEAGILSEIIEETAFATSDKDTKPVLTGVNIKAQDGKLICTATDSYRLAKKTIDFDSPVSFNITIPAKSLNEVRSIMLSDPKKQILIAENDKKAQFISENTILQTRLLDGGYPDTDRLIPSNMPFIMTVERSEFISVLDRGMFIKNDNKIVNRLQCSETEIIISNKSQEVGDYEDSLTQHGATYEGEPLDISFSGTYVMQAVKAIKGNTIKISFAGEMKPFIITDPEDPTIVQLALPVRTYN